MKKIPVVIIIACFPIAPYSHIFTRIYSMKTFMENHAVITPPDSSLINSTRR